MNADNQRLKEIQIFKNIYYHELHKADTITDCLNIQNHIDELETEEKEILSRCDVKI